MKKAALFFLASLSLSLFGDYLDVETLPLLRTEKYSKGPYDKIVVFSAPRTGSSLVYNVTRFLFEKESSLLFHHNEFRLDRSILKTHRTSDIEKLKKQNEKVLYLVTMRDPIQASISMYRVNTSKETSLQKFAKQVIERHLRSLRFVEQLQKAGLPVHILRYEDFEKGQIRSLLDAIESRFHIVVSEKDVQTLEEGYSRENIYANIQSLASFQEYFPISGFHGKHVPSEPFTPPEELVFWLNHYLEESKSLFTKYGY